MKKLFKLFPVALAAFALASCSSDDLNGIGGEEELAYSPNLLQVQVEGEDDETVTRGGYITSIYDYNIRQALVFDEGDLQKLYHQATSWKPEIWRAGSYDQYKNAKGTSAFEAPVGATIAETEEAYGIYPSTASVFGNEERTAIQFDFTKMAFVDYVTDATKSYIDAADVEHPADEAVNMVYKAEFPLWGVKAAGAKVMTMKHLAGIVRLDIAKITPPVYNAVTPNYKYIIVRSKLNKLTGKMNTAADLLNPDPTSIPTDIILDPSKFMEEAPALPMQASTAAATDATIPLTEAGAEAKDNVIVIRLDYKTPSHLMAFFPISKQSGGQVFD